ncbi:hypothetical protein L9F63_007148, partial [Diploptera punctata]
MALSAAFTLSFTWCVNTLPCVWKVTPRYVKLVTDLCVPGPAPTIIFPEPGGSLETSRSTLELEADSATFRDTKLRLRCEASLFQMYRRSSEELELHEDTPQLASVLGPSIA